MYSQKHFKQTIGISLAFLVVSIALSLPQVAHATVGSISGGVGGAGLGTVSTGGGGGGRAPRPSGIPATSGDCPAGTELKRDCIPLIQPLGPKNTVDVLPGAQTFYSYFNEGADLILTASVGIAVLWILLGSYFIMVSGSDGGKRSTGKKMITGAMIGLIIVNFAGFFLRTLNSVFFT